MIVIRPLEDLPYIKVPLHTLIKLTPQAYGCEAEFIRYDSCVFIISSTYVSGFPSKRTTPTVQRARISRLLTPLVLLNDDNRLYVCKDV